MIGDAAGFTPRVTAAPRAAERWSDWEPQPRANTGFTVVTAPFDLVAGETGLRPGEAVVITLGDGVKASGTVVGVDGQRWCLLSSASLAIGLTIQVREQFPAHVRAGDRRRAVGGNPV